tara:strand:+ start:3422 stop:3553 length:132 start_codon:yes stop_codon:yes gene_type:complete
MQCKPADLWQTGWKQKRSTEVVAHAGFRRKMKNYVSGVLKYFF